MIWLLTDEVPGEYRRGSRGLSDVENLNQTPVLTCVEERITSSVGSC